ncbi:MAG TPA: carboxypeptidase-like regulatory domain-containing protein [Conexibacter sp.]|jgi:hypothetical protein
MRAQRLVPQLLSLLLACACATALAGAAAPSAWAGTYDVYSCRGPLGEDLSAAAWRTSTTAQTARDDVFFRDDCESGDAFDLTLNSGFLGLPAPGGQRGLATFTAPLGARIVSYDLWRSLTAAARPPGLTQEFAAAVRERSPSGDSDDGCESDLSLGGGFDCNSPGDPENAADPGNEVNRSGLDLDAVQLWVGCVSNGCDPAIVSPAAQVRLFRSVVELEDDTPPQAARLTGTVVGSQAPLTGPITYEIDADDDGSGVAEMAISVDGGPYETAAIDTARGTCHEPYTLPQPCPSDAAHVFTLDRDTLAPGFHTLNSRVEDAVGNEESVGSISFVVGESGNGGGDEGNGGNSGGDDGDNGNGGVDGGGGEGDGNGGVDDRSGMPDTPPVQVITQTVTTTTTTPGPPPPANGEPAVATPRLRFARSQVMVASGRTARLSGTLLTADGQPIAGATLNVSSEPLGTDEPHARRLPSVTTDAAGHFDVQVRAAGAQRVIVSFAPAETAADTATFEAVVRSPASLTISRSRARLRRGQSVVLSGRLKGTGSAAKGAVVEMQAIVHGRWRTVASVHAARNGSYRWPYRFVSITRDTIFSFRALVERTPGWPWPQLASKRISVRVDAPS